MIREATAALVPAARTLPVDVLWDMLTGARAARRRAAYRLLQRHDRATQARAALLLAGDPHPSLARRGIADITRIARLWRRGRAQAIDLDRRQAADLRRLIGNAAAAIGADTTRLLRDQLKRASRA